MLALYIHIAKFIQHFTIDATHVGSETQVNRSGLHATSMKAV